jgi:hypothetical protein
MATDPAEYVVVPYAEARKSEWDAFVARAKNATFLFCRDYMDYHRDRFTDQSLMIVGGGRLIGVLPASREADGTVVSHAGLTYGGLAVSREAKLVDVLGCFHAVLGHLRREHVASLVYKRIPSFYNTLPDDDVGCALFLLDARLCRRDCAIVVSLADRLPLQKRRAREVKRAAGLELRVKREENFAPFWERVLVPRLAARYGVRPVHSVEEIERLASRFPDSIKLFAAHCGDDIVAGTVIYETPTVAHAQYIATTDAGQRAGALDYLFHWLISEQYRDKRYFDFGNCSENEGRELNRGLLDWKEGFGGRAWAQDFYQVDTAASDRLEAIVRDAGPGPASFGGEAGGR